MQWSIVATVLTVTAASVAPRVLRKFHPSFTARVMLTLMLGAGAATLGWASLFVAVHLVHAFSLPSTLPGVGFVQSHGPVPAWIGALSLVLLCSLGWRVITQVVRWRREQAIWASTDGLRLVDDPSCHAFAVPGRWPTIVLTRGMIELLPRDELRAVVEHERSHLRSRHARFLFIARAAAAVCPLLWPALRRVQFCLERWADEEAAAQIGDRSSVARAIARAALGPSASPLSLAFGGGRGALRRVGAMLEPSPPPSPTFESLALAGGGAAATGIAGSAMQVHHAMALVF